MSNAVLKIPIRTLNRAKASRIEMMRAAFTACVRFHRERIEATGKTGATALHRECYREARERFPLPASTIQQARDKAIQAHKGYRERRKHDPRTKPPTFRRALPLRLAAENLRVFPERGMVRITTPEGFLWLPIIVPKRYQTDINKPHGVSELVWKGDRLYLMLVIKREDVPARTDGPHFGLDLGLAQRAVLSGPGVVQFFDGKPLRYVRGRYFRYRQALQQKRKTGMVKRSKGKESRWVTDQNHKVSRSIINTVAEHGGTLHVERLKGIRERAKSTKKTRRMLHSWPFGQLLTFLQDKAAQAGVSVVEEDPRHTSQRCSRCGHTDKRNRAKQAEFACRSCDYRLHADLNAARNLAARGACSSGVGDVAAPLSGEAVLSGDRQHGDNRNLVSFHVGSRRLEPAEDVTAAPFSSCE